jgi:homoserine O-succinyltransferase
MLVGDVGLDTAFEDRESVATELVSESRLAPPHSLTSRMSSVASPITRLIHVGIVNAMPSLAFKATDEQFTRLLMNGSLASRIRIHRFGLPSSERKDPVVDLVANGYRPLEELFGSRLDALIVTGTEPASPRLVDEPAWEPLCRVIDWALRNTVSTVLSCLAAHAATLLLDDLDRGRLPIKCFGVVDNVCWTGNPLAAGLPARVSVPHSHWNAVDLDPLLGRGYEPLLTTQQEWSAVTRDLGGCSLLLFQGHPEYGRLTLLREYRRDIRRFREGRLKLAPLAPRGYLAGTAIPTVSLHADRDCLEADSFHPADFPWPQLSQHCQNSWGCTSRRLYENWLNGVRARVFARTLVHSGNQ